MPDYKQELKEAIINAQINKNMKPEEVKLVEEFEGLKLNKSPEQYLNELSSKDQEMADEINVITDERTKKQNDIAKDYDIKIKSKENEYNEIKEKYTKTKIGLDDYHTSMLIFANKFNDKYNITEKDNQLLNIVDKINKEREEKSKEKVSETKAYEQIANLDEVYGHLMQAEVMQYFGYETIYKNMQELAKPIEEEYNKQGSEFAKYKEDMLKEKEKAVNSVNYKDKELADLSNERSKLIPDLDKAYKYKDAIEKRDKIQKANLPDYSSIKVGLDKLTEARAEYRNNLNGWQRMWANILPSSLYGPAKYVDKINAYKEALFETPGVRNVDIEGADPSKDKSYKKDKDGKYVKEAAQKESKAKGTGEKKRVSEVNKNIAKETSSESNDLDKSKATAKTNNLNKNMSLPGKGGKQ